MKNPLFVHHDGSEIYLSNIAPEIGEEVTFRFRISNDLELDRAMIRVYHDGEPRLFEMAVVFKDERETWWGVVVPILNPVMPYRFLVIKDGNYSWLNAAGLFPYEVTSTNDFKILARPSFPQWINRSVFYQIFPDRFASSGVERKAPENFVRRDWDDLPKGKDPTTGVELFGGDLLGVEHHLNHIVELGVNGIYFTPFFPANSTHRYDASSFDHVDPLLGGDKAMFSLKRQTKKLGIAVMGDLTTNHCGRLHPWLVKALQDKKSKERAFFYWDKAIPHGYVGWWGLASLPKFNFSSEVLKRRLYSGKNSIVRKWLQAPYSMAGWRIDVGNMTGRYLEDDFNSEVILGIRQAMDETNPDAWLVAENADHFPADLNGLGWHGTMNYNGFMRPVWGWLNNNPEVEYGFFGQPTDIPHLTGSQLVAAMTNFNAGIPWRNLVASMLLLDSHDTARFRNVVGKDPVRHLAGMALLLTYPGVPSIFAGDEIGLEGAWGEDARRTIPWKHRDKWDIKFFEEVKRLVAIRRNSEALALGGLRFIHVTDDVIAFLRESHSETVLVVTSRNPTQINFSLVPYGYVVEKVLYGSGQIGATISRSDIAPAIGIYQLSRS
jgi:alpha-glucosidase